MPLRQRILPILTAIVLLAPSLAPSFANAALTLGLIDRKFPNFQFCPVETRNGNLVSFVAPANGTVKITFAADNFFPDFDEVLSFNDPRIDNVMVMTIDQWNQNQGLCSSDCFGEDFTSGSTGAPAYPSDASSTSAIAYAELFGTAPSDWEGGTWVAALSAPSDDPSATDCTFASAGGALALGDANAGPVPVSAAVTVSGLTPGVTYVVFCWFYLNVTDDVAPAQLVIQVDETNIVPAETISFGTLKASFR